MTRSTVHPPINHPLCSILCKSLRPILRFPYPQSRAGDTPPYKAINPAKTAANKLPPSTANPAAAPVDGVGENPDEVVVVVAAVSAVWVADDVLVAVPVAVEVLDVE